MSARPESRTLEVIFHDHYPSLLGFAAHLAGSRADAEDLVQETFVRCEGRLASVPRDAIGAYLRTTLVNLWRSRWRRLTVERRALALLRARATFEMEGPAPEGIDLWMAVRRLPDRQRVCVALRFGDDLRVGEIADILGCSEGSVKRHLGRAMARLRQEVEHA